MKTRNSQSSTPSGPTYIDALDADSERKLKRLLVRIERVTGRGEEVLPACDASASVPVEVQPKPSKSTSHRSSLPPYVLSALAIAFALLSMLSTAGDAGIATLSSKVADVSNRDRDTGVMMQVLLVSAALPDFAPQAGARRFDQAVPNTSDRQSVGAVFRPSRIADFGEVRLAAAFERSEKPTRQLSPEHVAEVLHAGHMTEAPREADAAGDHIRSDKSRREPAGPALKTRSRAPPRISDAANRPGRVVRVRATASITAKLRASSRSALGGTIRRAPRIRPPGRHLETWAVTEPPGWARDALFLRSGGR